MEWIRRTVDYRTLIGKRDHLGYALGPLEAARLAELERFFAAAQTPELEAWAQREQARVPISIVVSFLNGTPSGGRGRVRDISGDGVFVETKTPLRPGSRTMLRVLDDDSGDEFRLGAEVVRVDREGMGLRFVGIPLALRVGHRRAPDHGPELTRRAA